MTAPTTTPQLLRQMSDLGNAETMVDLYGGELLYDHKTATWFGYDTTRWAGDEIGHVDQLAGAAARWRLNKAVELPDGDERSRQIRWALKSESRSGIAAAVDLARSIKGIPVDVDAFDADPYQLNCANGIVDLKTGMLQAHRREAMCSLIIPIPYDPTATCPRFLRFLDEIFAGELELVDYLQRLVGLGLIGAVLEHLLVIFHGRGENGKSTLFKVLGLLFGEYAMHTPSETFLARDRRRGGASPDLARMRGARLITTSETGEGRRLDEAGVKAMTGGDTIVARHLYSGYFEYTPRFLVVMATNHKPAVRGTDHAIWRRIHLVPFDVQFPPDKREPGLDAKLATELPGILTWAVSGCLEYQAAGLNPPASVIAATQTYRRDMDVLGGFIDECCNVTDVTAKVTKSALYTEYKAWAADSGIKPAPKTTFGLAIRERGIQDGKTNGAHIWRGITLQGHRDIQ